MSQENTVSLQFRFSQCRDDSSQGSQSQVQWFPSQPPPSQPPPPEEAVLEKLLESQNSERPIHDIVSQPDSQTEVTEWYQLLESDFPPFILRGVASPTSSQTTDESSNSQPLFSTSESGFGSENSSNED